MKYDIDNELIPYLFCECEWECGEYDIDDDEADDVDAETMFHPHLEGVIIRLNDVPDDRRGGLQWLLLEIYDQAVAYGTKQAKAEAYRIRDNNTAESQKRTMSSEG